jgi:hypothetical protein
MKAFMQTQSGQDSVRKNLSTQNLKKDKFKPLFCGKDFYVNHQNEFMLVESELNFLPPKEQLIIWTITLSCLRRKRDWYAGFVNFKREKQTPYLKKSEDSHFLIYNLFQKISILWPKNVSQEISILDFLKTVMIKPIPEAAMSGLFHFFTGLYDLEILSYEPRPAEILNYQIQNKRILTFDSNYKLWPEKIYGQRDVLSFLLHDFIHAEHFLSDPQNHQCQIGFYKFIQKILDHKILKDMLLTTEFNAQFSYLISDMNSHVVHLLKTLHAIIFQQQSKSSDPMNVSEIWLEIVELVHQKPNAHVLMTALKNVNSPLFSISDASALLHFFQNEHN